MKIYADLHFHSKYSRAVSPKMELENINQWATKKGLDLVTTSDFTHPLWIKNLKNKLVSVNRGIYQLKNNPRSTKFIVNTELSFIYDQHKIHLLVFVPNLEIAEEINRLLTKENFNLLSDGRPILGIPPQKFIKMSQKINKNIFYLPAHIWTPWFSLFGSKSGYDSIKACFGKYTSLISAIESGLSSDPLMNWQIKELDDKVITSFSDAHSPSNLGREITIFDLPKNFTYQDVISCLKKKNNHHPRIRSTVEFYPEEGKYHYTGHRKCKVCHSPEKTKKLGTTCPVCGKPLTVGVIHRVNQLSRKIKIKPIIKVANGLKLICHPENTHPPFIRLIPLQEIIAEAEDVGPKTKTVSKKYQLAVNHFKNELNLLINVPIEKIQPVLGKKISQGIKKNRLGELSIKPGYDGLYGQVKIWDDRRGREDQKQKSLF